MTALIYVGVKHLAGASSDAAESRILNELMKSLGKVKRAILLVYLDDFPAKEAAETLGMSEGNIRVRVHWLKKKYQEMFVR